MKTHGYNYINTSLYRVGFSTCSLSWCIFVKGNLVPILKHSIFLIVKSLDASCLARFVCSQDEVEDDSSHGNDSGQRLRAWYVVVKIQWCMFSTHLYSSEFYCMNVWCLTFRSTARDKLFILVLRWICLFISAWHWSTSPCQALACLCPHWEVPSIGSPSWVSS